MTLDRGGALRHVTAVAATAGGVVIGHAVAYVIEEPDAMARARHLAVTGHGYWQFAAMVGFGAALIAFAGAAASGATGATIASHARRQLAAFVVLEAAERAAAHASSARWLTNGDLWWGAVIQLVIAVALAWLLRAIARLGTVIKTTQRDAPRHGHAWPPPKPVPMRVRIRLRLGMSRAPPAGSSPTFPPRPVDPALS